MSTDLPDADQIADLLLPLSGPYPPDRVLETARTIAELVRRLNHATYHASALRYPPTAYRTISALRSAMYGLQQTLNQIADRLDTFTADPRVEHDAGADPALACAQTAIHLRTTAGQLAAVTAPLDAAAQTSSHLGYDTTCDATRRGPARPPRVDPAASPPTGAPPPGHRQPGRSR